MKLLSILLAAVLPIIPYPQEVTLNKGFFNAKGASFTCEENISQEEYNKITLLAHELSAHTERSSSIAKTIMLKESAQKGAVKGFIFYKDSSIPAEGYRITVSPKSAQIVTSDYKGLLNALSTIRQMLPPEIYSSTGKGEGRWAIPCCEINDYPRFAWRGMHLDCSRHFWSVEEVKKYLDIMSMYKLNRFHWHLTDDQGWRIEIKKYPLLTEIGGFRSGTAIGKNWQNAKSDGIRYGGFYTQEQVRDIISYAAELGIEVVPEIDLPGHMLAAIASYPELSCTSEKQEVWTQWGISEHVLCAGKETTFTFLEGVLGELAELFPYEYIHIGGDECPKTEWEKCPLCQAKIAELGLTDKNGFKKEQYLQTYVTARVQKFLASKGKKIIGWDEIMEGTLEEGATIMSWRGTKGGIEAAQKGFKAIMTPYTYCYFDYRQSNKKDEPGVGNVLGYDAVYKFNPVEGLNETQAANILGVQANLWTEFIRTNEHLEFMLLPRLQALSEVQWCNPENKNLGRFKTSLKEYHLKALDFLGYNYRPLD
ncbi:MAG: beta-N-acetylhexosaminidase [Bacteroidales bacterium]|nr:beta-N-acetylhexosaminidase [Candidatus Cryptobacteroides fimicaballi]